MRKPYAFFALLLLAQPALARDSYDPDAIKPLETVLKHFDLAAKHPKGDPASAKARALGRAYDALERDKTARARALAAGALNDPLFSDYAHWIVAQAFEMDAEKAASTRKKNARAAQSAFTHFRAIQDGSPYSPLIRFVPRQLGQAELLVAYGLVPGKESVRRYEDALMRLQSSGELSDVSPDEALGFAKACKKSPDALCEPWLLRLTERMDRESDEFDSIAELFPAVKDRPSRPELPPRPTQAYHAPDLDFAAFDDAMASFSDGKWGDAQDKLQKFLDEFPKSSLRFRARYWLARVLVERGKKDDAQKEYDSLEQETPLSFYGLLAAMDNGKPIDQRILQTDPLAVERDPLLSAAEAYHLHRAEVLLAANAGDLAAMDLREIRPRNALSSPFLMYLCALDARSKNYPSAFVLLSELIQRDYPAIVSANVLKMIFPVENLDEIGKYAKQEHVDPILVLSLIKQESAFDRRAVSGAGASGLMQLMYFTATQANPGISRDDLLEADPNIRTGTRYLASLLERYHGNVVFALAAYNAGPAAVDRWVKDGEKRKLDMLEFIESIPYHETRDYVSSIIRNYYWYSKLLGAIGPDVAASADAAKDAAQAQAQAEPKPLSYFWRPYLGSP